MTVLEACDVIRCALSFREWPSPLAPSLELSEAVDVLGTYWEKRRGGPPLPGLPMSDANLGSRESLRLLMCHVVGTESHLSWYGAEPRRVRKTFCEAGTVRWLSIDSRVPGKDIGSELELEQAAMHPDGYYWLVNGSESMVVQVFNGQVWVPGRAEAYPFTDAEVLRGVRLSGKLIGPLEPPSQAATGTLE
jgi:hypothetical protein